MAVHSKEIHYTVAIANLITNEVPSGAVNSINTVFTISNSPVNGTVQVILNGLLQKPGIGFDYIISNQTITFIKAPHTNSEILVHYIKQ